jgi:hypothetical protein
LPSADTPFSGESGCEQFPELCVLALEAGADLLAEAVHDLVGDPVIDERALFASPDNAGVEKHPEVLGHVLLTGAGGSDQLLDASLPVHQLLEQADAERLAEGAETLGDELDDRLGKWM